MPINSNNAYRFSQIKKRRLTSQEAWLTQRLHELKTRIALQTKQKVNQPELQKQNIIDLTRQINAYLDQINTVQIRNILKTTLTLPQIEDKPEDISFAEENKQNLRTAIFHYLIQFDPKNPNKENKPRILSDQKIEALHLLLKILDKSNKDNVNSLVATWVKRIKQKNITSVTLILKKNLFEDHFLNEIMKVFGIKKLGELEKLAKPCDCQDYDKIREEVESSQGQTLKSSPK